MANETNEYLDGLRAKKEESQKFKVDLNKFEKALQNTEDQKNIDYIKKSLNKKDIKDHMRLLKQTMFITQINDNLNNNNYEIHYKRIIDIIGKLQRFKHKDNFSSIITNELSKHKNDDPLFAHALKSILDKSPENLEKLITLKDSNLDAFNDTINKEILISDPYKKEKHLQT
jgi:hypothetical protein